MSEPNENLAPATAAAPPQTAEQINRPQTGMVEIPAPAPPPAAALVTQGVVRSEREAQLETELASERTARRKAEAAAAEAERVKQDLLEQTRNHPAARPTVTKKRAHWLDDFI